MLRKKLEVDSKLLNSGLNIKEELVKTGSKWGGSAKLMNYFVRLQTSR